MPVLRGNVFLKSFIENCQKNGTSYLSTPSVQSFGHLQLVSLALTQICTKIDNIVKSIYILSESNFDVLSDDT